MSVGSAREQRFRSLAGDFAYQLGHHVAGQPVLHQPVDLLSARGIDVKMMRARNPIRHVQIVGLHALFKQLFGQRDLRLNIVVNTRQQDRLIEQ